MYRILVDGSLLHDPATGDAVVYSATLSQSENECAFLDLSVSPTWARPIREGVSRVVVEWDGSTLFAGVVESVEQDTEGWLDVSCASDVDRLNDVLLRPHSTDGSVGEQCPSGMADYVAWLFQQYGTNQPYGPPIWLGTNEGDLIAEEAPKVEEDGYVTVADALSDVLEVGGHLDFVPNRTGGGTCHLYADYADSNAQVIDFGENVVDVTVEHATEDQRTALVPTGDGVTLADADEGDLALVANAGFVHSEDAIWDPAACEEYGYREEVFESDTDDPSTLVREAVAHLRSVLAPRVTVSARAVDLALYREGHEHLRVGQAVRVRCAPQGVDEYMAVTEMDLDLLDPSATKYVLGTSYDTMTGQQSKYLRGLNSSINESLDAVGQVSQVVGDGHKTYYYVSSSDVEPVGGEWADGVTDLVDNSFVWSKPVWWEGGEMVEGEPVLVTGHIRRTFSCDGTYDQQTWVLLAVADGTTDAAATGGVRVYGTMGGHEASENGPVDLVVTFQGTDPTVESQDEEPEVPERKAGQGVVTQRGPEVDLAAADVLSYVSEGRVRVWLRLSGDAFCDLYVDGYGLSSPMSDFTDEPEGTVAFDLAGASTTYESDIQQTDESIRSYVNATFATATDVAEMGSSLEQRADAITATLDTTIAQVEEQGLVTQKVSSTLTFETDDQGNPVLVLARSGSALRSELTNESVTFRNGSETLLSVDGPSSRVMAGNLWVGDYRIRQLGDRLSVDYFGQPGGPEGEGGDA